VACGVFIGLGYMLMSQVSTLWQLWLFAGVIVGIGMGGAFVPMVSTVARWFTKRRGMMTGIVVSGVGIGMMIIPPVAGQLVSLHGWRNSYIMVGVFALVGIILAAQFMKRDPYQSGLSPYGGETKSENPHSANTGFSLREAIYNRQFWILAIAFFCFGYLLESMAVHIAPHAADLGVPVASAGNVVGIMGTLSAVGRIAIGSASDRIGIKQSIIIGFALQAIALFGLALTKEVWMLYLFTGIFGFAFGGVITMESPVVAELFGLSSHGVILGVILFVDKIGGAIGPILTGRIFDVTGSYQLGFLISGTLSIIGIILAISLQRGKKHEFDGS
jgi:MFS family permease